MVKVSKVLYGEIEKVKVLAKNSRDIDEVIRIAKDRHFSTLLLSVRGNPRRYLKCLDEGMDCE